jgi:hypothetical protein
MDRGPTNWEPKGNLHPVVAGEGPGVATGYWGWNPPKELQ